jgi:hypothetical protein
MPKRNFSAVRKLVHAEAEALNRGCEQPVAGVRHRARQEQVLHPRTAPSLELGEAGAVSLVREKPLNMRFLAQRLEIVPNSCDFFVCVEDLMNARRKKLLKFLSSNPATK